MGDVYDCDYCGTPVTDKESGPLETSTGRRHYDSVCREYVFAVKESYRKEASSLTAQLAARDARVKALDAALLRCIGTPEGNERDVDGGDGDANLSDVGLFRLGVEHAYADLDSDEEQIIAARRAIEDEARALLADAVKEET
jgi:hypothetical protein